MYACVCSICIYVHMCVLCINMCTCMYVPCMHTYACVCSMCMYVSMCVFTRVDLDHWCHSSDAVHGFFKTDFLTGL